MPHLAQEYLETVLPAIGGVVLIVNGANRGSKATLQAVDVDKYTATVKPITVWYGIVWQHLNYTTFHRKYNDTL